jgi:hypothetical protein
MQGEWADCWRAPLGNTWACQGFLTERPAQTGTLPTLQSCGSSNRSLKTMKTMTPMIAAEASVEISAPRYSRNGSYGIIQLAVPISRLWHRRT